MKGPLDLAPLFPYYASAQFGAMEAEMSRMVSVIEILGGALNILGSQTSWAAPCGNVGYEGCCDGTTAKYCSSGVLKSKSCIGSSYGSKCGWVASQRFYSCNATDGKDPSGKYERDCSKLPPKADAGAVKKDSGTTSKDSGSSTPCGNVSYIGCCTGATAKYCSGGKLSTKDCTKNTSGPACGWVASKNYYSCNKTATTDPSGKNVRDCAKLPPKADAGATKKDYGSSKKDTGSSAACGAITAKGCCQGETAKFCASGKLSTKACSGSTPKCGWDTSKSFYTCGTSGLSDPAGKYPKACGGTTKQDSGSVIMIDKGGSTPKKDLGGNINPVKKDDSGSCSLAASSASPSGLTLTLILLALALRRRRR